MKLLTSQAGFTLVEMVTVLAVIGVLSALVIANTQVGNRRQQLRDAAAGYVTAAHSAETLASSGQVVGPTGSQAARKAYGVCITSSQIPNARCDDPTGKVADTYQVFARSVSETAPKVKDVVGNRPGVTVAGDTDQPFIVSSAKLPENYIFSTPNVWLDYLPPSAELFTNGLQPPTAQVVIRRSNVVVCTGGNKDCATILIRPKAGAVYVQ